MITDADRAALALEAQQIVAGNKYLTLSTADAHGLPWVSPVYFTPDADGRYLWVSSPTTRHSRNLEVRREVAIVIFDSTVPIGEGHAVYVSAVASRVPDSELRLQAGVFNSRLHELAGATVDGLVAPGPLRLYRAVAQETSVLLRGGDPRNSDGIDTRVVVG